MSFSRIVAAGLAGGLVILIGANSALADSTIIRGRVIFKGNPADFGRDRINTGKDRNCALAKRKIGTFDVILNKKTDPVTIRNVLVSIKSGLSAKDYPVPTEPEVLTQFGCEYDPHVLSMMEGQKLKVLNGDNTNHNIHFLPKVNEKHNFSQPKKDLRKGRILELEAEAPFRVKCDVHAWMACYIGVFKHPFHDVTKKEGKFEMKGMGGGKFTLEAWHETFGTLEAEVEVAAGETAVVDFVFDIPPKKKP